MRPLPVFACLALSSFAVPALAHDNSQSTVGLGFDSQFSPVASPGASAGYSNGNPGPYTAFSAKRAFTPRLEASALFGFALDKAVGFDPRSQGDFTFAAKGDWVLIPEPNMNLYLAVGVGISVGTISGLDQVTYFTGPGIEFFVPAWPHLGFFTEFGVGGNAGGSLGGHPFLGTYGSDVAQFGLHYYF